MLGPPPPSGSSKSIPNLSQPEISVLHGRLKTVYVELGSPWQNGYNDSLNGKLTKECLSGKIFSTLVEAKVLVERSRRMYNMVRPHSAVECKATGRGGYRDPRSSSGPALTPPV